MRLCRASLALIFLLALNGCGYVHFGRLPVAPASDGSAEVAYSNLLTQQKILQQELALAHKEGDALRAAIENRGNNGGAAELTARLNETTRELAALRASYTKLSGTKSGTATPDPEFAAKLSVTEEKLASSLRRFTQLQEENARLRAEVDQTRTENSALTAQVKAVTAESRQAQDSLAQLNVELLMQMAARSQAEQQTANLKAQLSAVVVGQKSTSDRATLSSTRESSADSTSTLKIAAAPPTDEASIAELRTSPQRLTAKTEATPPESPSAAPPPQPAASLSTSRVHVVEVGDTLEKLAKKYYGDPAKWSVIYSANNAQLTGQPLRAGMQLAIPEN